METSNNLKGNCTVKKAHMLYGINVDNSFPTGIKNLESPQQQSSIILHVLEKMYIQCPLPWRENN